MQPCRPKTLLPCFLLLLAVGGFIIACGGKPEQIYSPPAFGNRADPPAVAIFAPANGAKFHAHDDLRLLVLATPHGTSLGPDPALAKKYADTNKWHFLQDPRDFVSVEFLAGTNSLGLRFGGMVSAGMRSQHGEAVPMIMTTVGYPALELIWRDVPAGSYSLTALATNATGLSTLSSPVNITVLP